MNYAEHRAEAERLLELAGELPNALITVDRKNVSAEDLQRLKKQAEEAFGKKATVAVIGNGVHADVSPLLLAANTHATLALVDLMSPGPRGVQVKI